MIMPIFEERMKELNYFLSEKKKEPKRWLDTTLPGCKGPCKESSGHIVTMVMRRTGRAGDGPSARNFEKASTAAVFVAKLEVSCPLLMPDYQSRGII